MDEKINVFLTPLVKFALGLYLALIFTAYYPFFFPLSTWLCLIGAFLAIVCLYVKFTFVVGVLFALISLNANIHQPISAGTELKNCQFNFTITQKTARLVQLNAENVVCHGYVLGKQTLNYWQTNSSIKFDALTRYHATATLVKKLTHVNPNEFDQEKFQFLHRQFFTVHHLHEIKAIPNTWRMRIRNRINQQIYTHLSHYAGLVSALLTGERSGLSNTQKDLLQRSGTGHILAISGLHVGIVGLWAVFIGQTLWAMSARFSAVIAPLQFACVFAFLAISAYAWLTGFSLSTQRAWIMFSTILLSRLLFYHFTLTSILFAFIVVLVLQPLSVLSVGFYLSFIATFIVQRILASSYPAVIKVLLIQIGINLTLLPIFWYAFGQFSTTSMVANLLLLPWLSFVVMPALFAAILLSFFTNVTWFWSFSFLAMDALWVSLTKLDQWLSLGFSWTAWLRPSLTITVMSVLGMLGLLTYRLLFLPLGLLPLGLMFVPINPKPHIIVADATILSALIHDEQHAILVNPGYRKGRRNDAHKWLRYLYQHRLRLSAIVLTDTNLKRAAATQTLRKHYPETATILAKNKAFIGNYSFCQPLFISDTLRIEAKTERCVIDIIWQDKRISVNHPKGNIVLGKGSISFNNITYHTQQLGQIRIANDGKLYFARQARRLWRPALVISPAIHRL